MCLKRNGFRGRDCPHCASRKRKRTRRTYAVPKLLRISCGLFVFELFASSQQASANDWEQRKAGDRLVVLRGGSPRPIESYITSDPSGVNWIKIGDVEPGSMYITRTSERIRREGVSKSREVFAGDLLLSNSMSFGRPYILQVNGCIHDGWLLIRDAEGRFDTIFLQQMLSTPSMARQYKALAAGGVVNNLNSELVQSATIAFPGKAEQIKIGALFQKLDSLIALHQRELDILKNLKQALLEKMFV